MGRKVLCRRLPEVGEVATVFMAPKLGGQLWGRVEILEESDIRDRIEPGLRFYKVKVVEKVGTVAQVGDVLNGFAWDGGCCVEREVRDEEGVV